ncbi:MAG TPA: hypothetical protein VF035_06960 [Longimicrobiales bacterium]
MRRIRTALLTLLAVTAGHAVSPATASAQRSIPAAMVGGVAGAASGGYIAISVIVAESRTGKYLHSYQDALGWRSAPVLIGGTGGAIIGLTDPDRLWRTMLYGGAGTLAGVGVGVLAGQLIWEGPEAKWAGGAIGAGLGMAIGSTLGVFLPLKDKDEDSGQAQEPASIPIIFTFRF